MGLAWAVVENGIWGWLRNAPAIGKWDPPIHVLNFLPRQRGRLRVLDEGGREVYREWRPDIVFTGHGVRTNGTEFISSLLSHTEESLGRVSLKRN